MSGIDDEIGRIVDQAGAGLVDVGRFLTLGGLAAYFIASLTDGSPFSLLTTLNLAKAVLLICGVAAIVDAATRSLMAAAVANIGAIFIVGRGISGWLSDTWWGNGFVQFLMIAGDVVLIVGWLGFLARAVHDRRQHTPTIPYELLVVIGGAAAAFFGVLTFREFFIDRLLFRTAGVWVVLVAIIVITLLVRTPSAMLAGGGAAALLGFQFLGDDYDRYGAVRYPAMLAMLGLAGLAGWQFAETVKQPVTAPEAFSQPGSALPGSAQAAVGFAQPAGATGTATDYSGFWSRFLASFIDGLIFEIPVIIFYASVIAALASESGGPAVAGVLVSIGLWIWILIWYCRRTARTGQSVGRSAAGQYLVSASSGETVSAGTVFGRDLAKILSAIPFYLGFLWMLWDPRKQTWHDKITNTVVVRNGPANLTGRSPFSDSGRQPFAPAGVVPNAAQRVDGPPGAPLPAAVPPPGPAIGPIGKPQLAPPPGAAPPPGPAIGPIGKPQVAPAAVAVGAIGDEEQQQTDPPPQIGDAGASVPNDLPPELRRHLGYSDPDPTDPVARDASPEPSGEVLEAAGPPEVATHPPRDSTPTDQTAVVRRLTLTCSDGRRVAVSSRLLVGRDPVADGDDGEHHVLVLDDGMVSKTHLAVWLDDDRRAWVVDRNSTNGVSVVRSSVELVIEPVEPFELLAGDVIKLGSSSLSASSWS